jgi:hypothetical protein
MVLVGIVLPTASLCAVKLGLRYIYKVYHTRRQTRTFAKLGLVFVVTAISSMALLLSAGMFKLLAFNLVGLLIMSMVANFDILAGRIPIYFMFSAIILGFAFGLNDDRRIGLLLGGLTNLALGSILHWLGEKYAAKRFQDHPNIVGFGMGDAFASGSLGALVGLPLAPFGLVIALILAVLYALPISMLEKRAITSMKVELGPGFFLATVVLLLFC